MFTVLIGAVILSLVLAFIAVVAGAISYVRHPDALTKRAQERALLADRINAL